MLTASLAFVINPCLAIHGVDGTERTIGALAHSLVTGNTCMSMCDP